jgi:hypothetical protein
MISAMRAVTAVSSPRGQDRAWPRMMIQARISGASAAMMNRNRRTDRDAQPLHVLSGPWHEPSTALRLPSEYQLKNRDTPNRIPPTIATTSPRSNSFRFIAAAA